MRQLALSVTVFAFVTFFVGCSAGDPPPKPALSDFATKLKIANEIGDGKKREETLVQLALEAGEKGQVEDVKQSLAGIKDGGTWEKTAYRAALRLAKAGKLEDAASVAREIGSGAVREEALAKIATGDTKE